MSLSVTSWFVDQCNAKGSAPVRKFLIGTSDYSDYVSRWPTLNVKWDDIRPGRANVSLINNEQTFNFFQSDKANIKQTCYIKLGFTHPTSGDELITLMSGDIERVSWGKGSVQVLFNDKFKQLAERILGTQNDPLTYNGSNYLPSQIAWYICVSLGGLSAVESTSNPDIDYASFLEWAKVFSGDSVYVKAQFEGSKCTEGLRKLARITRSAIYRYDNKISFKRYTITDTISATIDGSNLFESDVEIDDSDIINKQYVMFDYSTTSKYHTKTVIHQASGSVNSFGLREDTEEDDNIWYVDSTSALNLAQRITTTNKEPFNKVSAKTGLQGIIRQVGETIVFTEEQYGITSESYRIMGARYDMNQGEVTFDIDASQIAGAFTLDVSTLDGTDVLA